MFKVMGYESGRYSGGFRVFDDERGFYDGVVADFDGDCQASRDAAQKLADRFNQKSA
jgi:hypothetical protein